MIASCWDDSVGDGRRRIELATKARELTEWNDRYFLEALAAAYAETGRFDDAVGWEKKALEHPEALGPMALEQAKAQLKLYEAPKPYHASRPEPAPVPEDKPPS